MSRVEVMSGNSAVADELIASVLQTDGRNPDALLARAQRRVSQDQIDEAIQDLNVFVVAVARANQAKGSVLRANQVFEQGVDTLPQSELLTRQYEAFLRDVGDPGRIVSLYSDLTYAKPSSVRAWQAYSRVCAEFTAGCVERRLVRGIARARTRYSIDTLPGAPRRTGLFAQIAPDQICRSTGGICTDS